MSHQKMFRGSATRKAVIEEDEVLSNAIPIAGFVHLGIVMPSAWTSASLTFQVSDLENGAYQDLYTDAGAEVEIPAVTAHTIGLAAVRDVLAPFDYMKIRSGTSTTSVSQEADRTLTVIMKS
jgi:hypothetical protein